LRVHLRGFARRDPEKGRLEQVDVVDEAGAGIGDVAVLRGGMRGWRTGS